MDSIGDTFSADPALCNRVLAAAQQNQEQLQLILDIVRHLRSESHASHTNGIEQASSKKRKLDSIDSNTTAPRTNGASKAAALDFPTSGASLQLSVPDVSFSIPVRKKLALEVWRASSSLSSNQGRSRGGGVRVTGKDSSYGFTWAEVSQVFCLPVPDKAARQHNFVILLGNNDGDSGDDDGSSSKADDERPRQFVFTLAETPVTGSVAGGAGAQDVRDGDTWVSVVGRLLNTELLAVGKPGIVLPAEDEFKSAVAQAHRKGESGYHVKAHLGTKEGYLFLLSTGILFGFRKPVRHFALEQVASISYTSVLQRTFNLNIAVLDGEEVEFAMLDQVDFAGIDDYVKRHGLNDESMARERQAKRVNVNGGARARAAGGDAVGQAGEMGGVGKEGVDGDDGEEGETELQRAERELQDREDEEEEDYDPSGGESEGEGEGEESDEEGGGDQGGDGVAEEDLAEELEDA